MINRLHLITLTIPFPSNYGGVIDVFYRIVALSELGVAIHLHCFKYERNTSEELEKYCEKVYYYDRKMNWLKLFSITPFIIKSRDANALTTRLRENPFPILYDGLHCTYTLNNPLLTQKKFIRTHNVETDYYLQLAKNESNLMIKSILYSEYIKLLFYEKKIDNVDAVFAISKNDLKYFANFLKSHLIRAFHSNSKIESILGEGNYALYHGNLTVTENINAIRFLLYKVFPKINFPLKVAGKITDLKLVKEIKNHPNVTLIENPNQNEMNNLIKHAQLILLPTFQDTGIKLKLLESLFKGRFCIVNDKMINNTELEPYCLVANTPNEWIEMIQKYKDFHFSSVDTEKRKSIMSLFNNLNEAKKMMDVIFNA